MFAPSVRDFVSTQMLGSRAGPVRVQGRAWCGVLCRVVSRVDCGMDMWRSRSRGCRRCRGRSRGGGRALLSSDGGWWGFGVATLLTQMALVALANQPRTRL
jgi:hypothetical protein